MEAGGGLQHGAVQGHKPAKRLVRQIRLVLSINCGGGKTAVSCRACVLGRQPIKKRGGKISMIFSYFTFWGALGKTLFLLIQNHRGYKAVPPPPTIAVVTLYTTYRTHIVRAGLTVVAVDVAILEAHAPGIVSTDGVGGRRPVTDDITRHGTRYWKGGSIYCRIKACIIHKGLQLISVGESPIIISTERKALTISDGLLPCCHYSCCLLLPHKTSGCVFNCAVAIDHNIKIIK